MPETETHFHITICLNEKEIDDADHSEYITLAKQLKFYLECDFDKKKILEVKDKNIACIIKQLKKIDFEIHCHKGKIKHLYPQAAIRSACNWLVS